VASSQRLRGLLGNASPARCLQGLWGCLLACLFPPKCLVCGSFDGIRPPPRNSSEIPFFRSLEPYFCPSCISGISPIGSPFCSSCGAPFISREGQDHTCGECLAEERDFKKARSFGVYEGTLLEAVHRLKYGKRVPMARPLALAVRKTFFEYWSPEKVDLLVPVPLHIKRLRERGFNQAYLLVMRWAKRDGLRCDGRLLRRVRWTEPQTTMNRKDRRKNVKGAFAVNRPELVRGKRIVLVDDVYTTGSTVNECAKVLKRAGAEEVNVLTLARAV
jgi:ComF family protein